MRNIKHLFVDCSPARSRAGVCVEEARLDGARAFGVIDAHHSFIMAHSHVLDEVVRFLRTGAFSPERGI